MPIIKLKEVDVKKALEISTGLIDELEKLIKCPRDYFNLSVDKATYIKDGEIIEGSTMVEVAWFDRGQEIQDETARIITKYINLAGYENVDVIFFPLNKSNYYENGNHF